MGTPLSIERLAERVMASSRHAPRTLVGIDGPGGSGKSTLAELLVERLPGAHLVHVDDFYLPTAQQQQRWGEIGPLFDLPRLRSEVIEPAARGAALRYRRYDWGTDALAEWVDVPAEVPLVIEGVYCLEQSVRDRYTFRIFCLADRELRLTRGLERDGADARSQWVDEWMPMEDAYVAAQRPAAHADLVVDSSASGGAVTFCVVQDNNQA